MYWRDLEHGAVGWMVICGARLQADTSPPHITPGNMWPSSPDGICYYPDSLWGCCGNGSGPWLSLPGEVLNENWSGMIHFKSLDIFGYSEFFLKKGELWVNWIDALGSETLMSHQVRCGVLSITPHVFFFFPPNQFCIKFHNHSS